MTKTDVNTLALTGKVASSKVWPLREGRTYTSGEVTLLRSDGQLKVKVSLSTDKWDQIQSFEKLFTRGRIVLISDGCFGGYEKDGVWVHQIDSGITKFSVADGDVNIGLVSGTIDKLGKTADGQALILDSVYTAKGINKNRKVKALIPTGTPGEDLIKRSSRVFLRGVCMSTDKGPFIQAQEIALIHG